MSSDGLRVGSLFSGIQPAASTSDSNKLGIASSSSAKSTSTGAASSPPTSLESPAIPKYETWVIHPDAHREGIAKTPSPDAEGRVRLRDPSLMIWQQDESCTLMGGLPPSIFSAEASPAKTSASPDAEPASPEHAADSSSNTPASPTLFSDQGDGSSLRTFPDFFPATVAAISPSYSRRWPTSGFTTSPGESWTADTSESPNVGAVSSSLRDVLEEDVPAKYFLSPKAAAGILRRAEKRGRELPSHLSAALEAVAQTTTTLKQDASTPQLATDPSVKEPEA